VGGSYNGCRQIEGRIVQKIDDLEPEVVALFDAVVRTNVMDQPRGLTLFALIIGPGNVPRARVELEHGRVLD
jgi:hypothetical protein